MYKKELSTLQLQKVAQKWLLDCGHIYQALNFSKCGFYESDVLGITASGIVTEIEVKTSRADFKADFNKHVKHYKMQIGKCKPNRFYYISTGFIYRKEVPEYAGLIELNTERKQLNVVKTAPFIHKEKVGNEVIISIAKHLTAKSILGCQPMTYKNEHERNDFEVDFEYYLRTQNCF